MITIKKPTKKQLKTIAEKSKANRESLKKKKDDSKNQGDN